MRSRTFKSGFGCFAVGCILTALALGNGLALGMLQASPAIESPLLGVLNWSFTILETMSVLLGSIGLMLPRYRESLGIMRRSIRSRRLIALLTPVWLRSSTDRKYLLRNRWMPLLDPVASQCTRHLQRRVVEIGDAQLRGIKLLPRDRVLLNQAEQLLQGIECADCGGGHVVIAPSNHEHVLPASAGSTALWRHHGKAQHQNP